MIKRISLKQILQKPSIVCLTAYTVPIANLVDGHVDLILVGDSLGQVLYGYESTRQVTIEMMQEFAAVNEINLIAFHGNRKYVHQTADSDKWLTMFVWDEHAYFSRTSRPYVQTPLCSSTITPQKVEMDRDCAIKKP